jgi:ESS family glutamate:Na+ symporter
MIAIVLVAILLLLGALLRSKLAWLDRARIPASVIAGVVGCVVAQAFLLAGGETIDAGVQSVLTTFRSWSGPLISIVFAGLLLAPSDRVVHRSRDVWQQGITAWIIILGQLALGLFATALLIKPFYDVPGPFGQFIEVTMAGGFGSANSMATILESSAYGFAPARDLLVFGATAGLLWGVVSGLYLAHFGQKRGWTSSSSEENQIAPLAPTRETSETSRVALEPILLQSCFLAIAFGIGLLMQWSVGWLSIRLDQLFHSDAHRFERHLGDLPLFFFALLGGWIVYATLRAVNRVDLLDRDLIHRLCGIAMDVLIVTSLAAIAFNQIRTYLWPVLLLLALGAIWSAFCLVWLSPRLLPRRYWFELGLINYGFSTAATAQGMMFLKLVDPKLKSGAAETYALGAPLTAPFIGGGVITFAVLPPLLVGTGLIPVGMAASVLVVVLFFVGQRVARKG